MSSFLLNDLLITILQTMLLGKYAQFANREMSDFISDAILHFIFPKEKNIVYTPNQPIKQAHSLLFWHTSYQTFCRSAPPNVTLCLFLCELKRKKQHPNHIEHV